MHTTEPGRRRRRYQNAAWTWTRGALLMILGIALVAWFLLYVTHQPARPDAAVRDADHVIATVLTVVGVALVVLGARNVRSGIVAGPDGLVVRQVIRRDARVPWPEVTGFGLIPAARYRTSSFTRSAVAAAVLRASLPPLYCSGCTFAAPSPRADEMVQALEAERRSRVDGRQTGRQTTRTGDSYNRRLSNWTSSSTSSRWPS
jgi:hypothetical protein